MNLFLPTVLLLTTLLLCYAGYCYLVLDKRQENQTVSNPDLFRNLDDKDYDQPDVHLQRMAWAWNITESGSLSCSPFQIMTGSERRALPATAMRGAWCGPPETDMKNKIDTAAAIANTSTYVKVAAAHADHMRRGQRRQPSSTSKAAFSKIFLLASTSKSTRRRLTTRP